jgi:putative inorganic carbon (HCO3(-)) transporter
VEERLFQGGLFLLPLVCWPGLDHSFSTPKLWLLACLDLGLAARFVARKGWRASGAIEWPWLVWLATLALSALLAPFVSREALLLMVLPLPLCWAARREWLPAILLGSAAESAIAVLQFARLDPLGWLGWHAEVFPSARMRVYGTLGNPDFVAAWLCATLPLYVAVPRKGARRLWWAALALQLAAILATGSRVFLLALPVAAVVLAVRGMRVRAWWLAAVPIAATVLWLSPARPLGVTIEGRLYYARIVASHWRNIPLLGYGPGSFPIEFAQWQIVWLLEGGRASPAARFAGELDHAHNDYLETWVEYGPVGLCAFATLLIWLVVKAWRPRTDPTGVWAGAASLLAIATVDFPFHRPAEWALFWVFLGIVGQSRRILV